MKLIAENTYGCNDTLIKTITVRVATSINASYEGLINIYPNPVENNLILNLSQLSSTCTISIVNILGEEVYRESLDTQISSKEVNTSNLTSGVYLLKIVSGNMTLTKKFNKL